MRKSALVRHPEPHNQSAARLIADGRKGDDPLEAEVRETRFERECRRFSSKSVLNELSIYTQICLNI